MGERDTKQYRATYLVTSAVDTDSSKNSCWHILGEKVAAVYEVKGDVIAVPLPDIDRNTVATVLDVVTFEHESPNYLQCYQPITLNESLGHVSITRWRNTAEKSHRSNPFSDATYL